LASAVPTAKLSTDTRDPQRLTAWASPADQATIKAIVEQIDVEGDPETSYSVADLHAGRDEHPSHLLRRDVPGQRGSPGPFHAGF
jgi:hypothetical protein